MTRTYTMRHLVTPLLLGLWVGATACGAPTEATDAGAESKAAPKPKPPAPPPEPPPAVPSEPAKVLPKTLASFEAVVEMATEIHNEHRRTFYCDCAYTPQQRIARGTCGYKTRADEGLSKRVAWDRVVPSRAFGEHRACWREPVCKDESGNAFSGVRCCREVDDEFRTMELDLHNLVPAVGELQADRSDFDFAELDGEARMYGACDFEVDRALQRAEPREDSRGDIARTYLYMQETYGEGLPLTPEELARFKAWDEADPATAWEVQRNRRIAAVQGSSNSFLPMVSPATDEDEPAEAPKAKPAPEKAPAAAEEGAADKAAQAAPEGDAAKPAADEAKPAEAADAAAQPTP
jgi:deoxyribonuclease-1